LKVFHVVQFNAHHVRLQITQSKLFGSERGNLKIYIHGNHTDICV